MQTMFSPRSAWSREFPRRMEPIECDEAVALVERIARDAAFLHQFRPLVERAPRNAAEPIILATCLAAGA